MIRIVIGLLISGMVGLGVELSGAMRWLPVDLALIPPEVPLEWAAIPGDSHVQVAIVSSRSLLSALSSGLSESEIALARPGAIALVDGRVFAISGASARVVLHSLAWDRLPMEVRQISPLDTLRLKAPAPPGLAWRAQQRTFAGLNHAREQALAHPGFTLGSFITALLLLIQLFVSSVPSRRTRGSQEPHSSPWQRRRAQPPVRVVLVPDPTTLAQVRTAIGEEHVIAAAEHAFAFAGGWILAAQKGSVFELMNELGWHTRPLEMTSRPELIAEGHALEAVEGDDPTAPLELLEALHVCGPLAHGTTPRLALPLLSGG